MPVRMNRMKQKLRRGNRSLMVCSNSEPTLVEVLGMPGMIMWCLTPNMGRTALRHLTR